MAHEVLYSAESILGQAASTNALKSPSSSARFSASGSFARAITCSVRRSRSERVRASTAAGADMAAAQLTDTGSASPSLCELPGSAFKQQRQYHLFDNSSWTMNSRRSSHRLQGSALTGIMAAAQLTDWRPEPALG